MNNSRYIIDIFSVNRLRLFLFAIRECYFSLKSYLQNLIVDWMFPSWITSSTFLLPSEQIQFSLKYYSFPGTKMMLTDSILALSQHTVLYHKLGLNEGFSWIDFHNSQWTNVVLPWAYFIMHQMHPFDCQYLNCRWWKCCWISILG